MFGGKHQDIVDKIERLRQSWLKDKKLRKERALKRQAIQNRKSTPVLPNFNNEYDSAMSHATKLSE